MMLFQLLLFLFFSLGIFAKTDDFEREAKQLAGSLKSSLLKEVTKVINEKGVNEAISFCHANVKDVAKKAGKDFSLRFDFGRTSMKVRNSNNRPEPWMVSYLEKFAASKEGGQPGIIHQLADGKRVYLEPIYMKPVCLQCHGENISQSTLQKIKFLYPTDSANGYRVGDFRGFVWVREK